MGQAFRSQWPFTITIIIIVITSNTNTNNSINNNRGFVTIAEHTSDQGKQTNLNTNECGEGN